jgi:hypothetical protein
LLSALQEPSSSGRKVAENGLKLLIKFSLVVPFVYRVVSDCCRGSPAASNLAFRSLITFPKYAHSKLFSTVHSSKNITEFLSILLESGVTSIETLRLAISLPLS